MVKSFYRVLAAAILLGCVVPVATIEITKHILLVEDPYPESVVVVPAIVLALACVLLFYVLKRSREAVSSLSRQQAEFLDALPEPLLDPGIAVAAGLSLFMELAVIRWQASEFTAFSFYKNFSLLACFGGLGLGYALAGRRSIPLVLTAPLLCLQAIFFIALKKLAHGPLMTALNATPISEQYNMGFSVTRGVLPLIIIYLFLVVVFLLTALAFTPVGQVCGRLMKRRENLHAYAMNLLGSILGVVMMLLLSQMLTPPVVWFGICFIILLALGAVNRKSLGVCGGAAVLMLVLLAWPEPLSKAKIHSPYQLIEYGSNKKGHLEISAAGIYHQRVLDLSPENVKASNDEDLKSSAAYYNLPYRVYGKTETMSVAVVGSGAGNDVAAALRAGAMRVDAIDIEPVIYMLGWLYHPESPYEDWRTHFHLNDARTYLRNTSETYDLIVYGLLDSHALLSHASSVRIDSFVYTVEGFREARERLKEGGVLSLSFAVMTERMGRKIYLMLQEAFDGRAPACIDVGYDSSVIFLAGKNHDVQIAPEILSGTTFTNSSEKYAKSRFNPDLSTDDWPFFYMPRRVYPVSSLGMLGLVAIVYALLVGVFIGEKPQFSHSAFFFLGAGFMLVETKAITELGLTFGNTWHVIGIVITGILFMAFIANKVVEEFEIRRPLIPLLLLLGSLGLGYAVARSGGLPSTALGRIGTLTLLTSPMFFSGIVFSTLLRHTKDIGGAMSMNLIGAMIGGLLEYNSMYFGFQFLYLLALALYVLALLAQLIKPARLPRGIGK